MFENAKFGDKFKTRNGQIVLFIERNPIRDEIMVVHNNSCIYGERHYNLNGRYVSDTVDHEFDLVTKL